MDPWPPPTPQTQGEGSPYLAAPYPPQRRGVNGFAIASLVLGILGICGGVVPSVAFGIVALVQIRRTRERGKGLAVAGLVLSGVWVLALAIAVVVAIASGADRGSSGQITRGGTVSVEDLAPGDCVNGIKEKLDTERILSLPAVRCDQAHEAEVFAVFDVAGTSWPGEQTVFDQAEAGCGDRLTSYAPAADVESLDIIYLYPTQQAWAQGDRGITCFAADPATALTGSIRD